MNSRNWTVLTVVGIVLALGAGLLVGRYWHDSDRTKGNRAEVEKIVREYILDHPEILPQAMENLQKRENAQALSGISDQVHAPFPGAVLGNPQGKVTLVEFTDFACTFCRQSVAEVEQLIAANPDLRVVVRELPILSPQSANAAKMALAAAEQGKYAAFHNAMYAAGQPSPETIAAAAQAAGLDMDRANKTIADPRLEAELTRNVEFARRLGFSGTPSWIAGDALLSGAVGKDRLAEAIEAARKG
ncbi:DsbA family protein [Novosphingobium sp. G106]|uniref:DsbA family protein n=1 Tax=Novosphingobium sp. G106 TaxID=2849500 RepID=UPI001C2CE709|nr:DsbA family protein [Novosphingobium sp. G106]MBV1689907.1 DsbA family protein [Novosphingobium sp. G106]